LKILVCISLSLLQILIIPGCITIQTVPKTDPPSSTQPGLSPQDSTSKDEPIIETFTVNPSQINSGQTATLSWTVTGADSVSISPDIGQVESAGTRQISPDVTTSYTLTARNSYGVVNIQLTVSVHELDDLKGVKEVVLHTISNEDGALIKYDSSYERQDIPCAGDDSLNLPRRAFLSFDISSIPGDATMVEALLDLSDCTITGDPTYVRGRHGNMGALEVYHYQYGSYDDLDRSAYIKIAQLTEGGSHQEYPLNPWKWDIKESTDGDPVIQELVRSSSSRCQLRIQFFTSTNWDGIADMICFADTNLVIRYKLP